MTKHSETVRGLIEAIAAETAERDGVPVGVVQYHIAASFVIDAARREADSLITGNSTATIADEAPIVEPASEIAPAAPATSDENSEAIHENG